MYNKYIKRLLDLILAIILLIILSPIYLIVILLVRIKLGKPILFKQERPGYKEKIFKMYKFRTMTNETDQEGRLLPDLQRLTKFGRILRDSSLDELPEIINIVKGEMSFVGPRPLLVQYLPLYNTEQRKRHEVRPGLTGLAQINGRNESSWEERFELDIEYVDNISFITDLKIIINTVKVIVKKEGIDADNNGKVTKELFKGSGDKKS